VGPTVIEPSEVPLHLGFVILELIDNAGACGMLIVWFVTHPLLSLTVAIYNPAAMLVAVEEFAELAVVTAGVHEYEKAATPVMLNTAEPVLAPKHVTDCWVTVTVGPTGLFRMVERVLVQPLPSEILTEYVPAARPVRQVAFPAAGSQV
jgi:hypothetical protein